MRIKSLEIKDTSNYRVIIYPASRCFSDKELKDITGRIYDFLCNWKAHGKELESSFKIEKNQFIIICVDEKKEVASGCSIDSLSKFMHEIDNDYKLGLFDRMKACYLEKGQVKTLKLSDFRFKVKNGEILEDIEVFDFSKKNYHDFLNNFLLPLKESWAGKID